MSFLRIVSVGGFESNIDPAFDLFVQCWKQGEELRLFQLV